MSEPIAYLNGAMVAITEAKLSVFDMGILQAATVTEMVRTFRLKPYRLSNHIDRLFRSIKAVGFDVELSPDELSGIVDGVVQHNAALVDAQLDLGISMFVTAGLGANAPGSSVQTGPTICVHTYPLPFSNWANLYDSGQNLVTPSIRHIPADCIDPKIKTRSRLHWYLADRQARIVDTTARSVLLDHAGNITETSTGNFFAVIDGEIVTPSQRTTLGGVSQIVVGELANRLNISFKHADIQTYDAINAEELFTTSTPYCILPVTRFNGQSVADRQPGPVFQRLLASWNDEVGLDIMEQMKIGTQISK